jgi:hypothetical protein
MARLFTVMIVLVSAFFDREYNFYREGHNGCHHITEFILILTPITCRTIGAGIIILPSAKIFLE